MKHLVLSFFFCLPFLLNAQPKTFIEVNYGLFKNNANLRLINPTSNDYFNYRSQENGSINPSAFVGFSRQLNRKYAIKTGLELQIIGFEAEIKDVPSSRRSLRRSVVSAPLLIKIDFLPTKFWHPYFETGVVTSYLLSEVTLARGEDQVTRSTSYRSSSTVGYDPLFFSVAANMGVLKDLSRGNQIFLQASSLAQVDKFIEFGISERIYNIGFNAGFKFALR